MQELGVKVVEELLLDDFYVAASTAGGQRDWTRGTYLSNAEQATGIIEWLSRWGLRPGTTRVVADDAVFNATGSDRGSTAGDFKAAGCPMLRAGKMNQREANGLALESTKTEAIAPSYSESGILQTSAN